MEETELGKVQLCERPLSLITSIIIIIQLIWKKAATLHCMILQLRWMDYWILFMILAHNTHSIDNNTSVRIMVPVCYFEKRRLCETNPFHQLNNGLRLPVCVLMHHLSDQAIITVFTLQRETVTSWKSTRIFWEIFVRKCHSCRQTQGIANWTLFHSGSEIMVLIPSRPALFLVT